ncbi:MAG: sarcosine oxidase subunit delta [Gaiellaceae bacterium]
MSFLLACPSCGPRDVNEFVCAGEVTIRPTGTPSLRELSTYVYFRKNVAGEQREWWFHRFGCEQWFQAVRDTRTNDVLASELVGRLRAAAAAPAAAAIPDTPAT